MSELRARIIPAKRPLLALSGRQLSPREMSAMRHEADFASAAPMSQNDPKPTSRFYLARSRGRPNLAVDTRANRNLRRAGNHEADASIVVRPQMTSRVLVACTRLQEPPSLPNKENR